MPKDAPLNSGAPLEEDPTGPRQRVSGMQAKLHRWAVAQPLGHCNHLTAETVESPLRRETHGGFGERSGETDREQSRHRAPGLLSDEAGQSDDSVARQNLGPPGLHAGSACAAAVPGECRWWA